MTMDHLPLTNDKGEITQIPGLSRGKPITIHPPVGCPASDVGRVATSRRGGLLSWRFGKSVVKLNVPLPEPRSKKSWPCIWIYHEYNNKSIVLDD